MKDAACIIGIFMLLSSCQMSNQRMRVTVDDAEKITYAYCAGMKLGEAMKNSLTQPTTGDGE